MQQVRSFIHRAIPRVSDVPCAKCHRPIRARQLHFEPIEAPSTRENLLDKEVRVGHSGQWRGDRTWTWPRFGYWSLKTGGAGVWRWDGADSASWRRILYLLKGLFRWGSRLDSFIVGWWQDTLKVYAMIVGECGNPLTANGLMYQPPESVRPSLQELFCEAVIEATHSVEMARL